MLHCPMYCIGILQNEKKNYSTENVYSTMDLKNMYFKVILLYITRDVIETAKHGMCCQSCSNAFWGRLYRTLNCILTARLIVKQQLAIKCSDWFISLLTKVKFNYFLMLPGNRNSKIISPYVGESKRISDSRFLLMVPDSNQQIPDSC